MEISPLFFGIFGGLAIAFSLLVVLKKNPVASAFSLVLVFFCFAGIYALLDAHLIAAMQILVYAGAIMVLFIFVIMLLNAGSPSLDMNRTPVWSKILSLILGMAMVAVFTYAFKESKMPAALGPFSEQNIEAAGGNTQVISELMFSEYILPFELTSVLLLAAMVGVVAIAKRKLSGDQGRS